MNKPSQYKSFHNGKLFQYREMLNFHAQTRIVQLCLIFYSYPATVIAMHLQEAFFFTAILVLMQAEHHNIKVKVVQIEKALNLPHGMQMQLHNTWVLAAAKRKKSIRRGNPNLLNIHRRKGR